MNTLFYQVKDRFLFRKYVFEMQKDIKEKFYYS